MVILKMLMRYFLNLISALGSKQNEKFTDSLPFRSHLILIPEFGYLPLLIPIHELFFFNCTIIIIVVAGIICKVTCDCSKPHNTFVATLHELNCRLKPHYLETGILCTDPR